MSKEIKTDLGLLSLSDEAIATIAGAAATECYGIVGMASRKVTDGLAELLGRENLAKGVEVSVSGDKAYITLNVIVATGVRINEVAKNVVEKVKYTVERATGLKVVKVRVNVQGLR
ncbi:MAG TPA: Asp23/Gls24 family envelope stress response protein [Firmicutes bacterium]|nr:Asp23/Gls24 family envelope stress response protein [Bacillota bacterium]